MGAATPAREDPRRPPLTPSENGNAGVSAARRPRNKEIGSRYLSSYSSPSPSSTSTSTSYSSSSPSTAGSTRRFPSPTVSSRSTPVRHQSPAHRRSSSVDRTRPLTTASNNAITTTTTTTRSLSVSFQGESFFFQTSRAKPTPERRSLSNVPADQHHHRPWPAAARSLDYSSTVQFTTSEERCSNSSDTDSVSSGSNSGVQEFTLPPRARVTTRGICVPVRFLQESHNRLPGSRSSPMRGPARQPSPVRGKTSPLRGRGSSPAASAATTGGSSPASGQPANAPSIISFAVEVRRAKKGEYRIEEAHLLRLLDNRNLQWRWVNARANSALLLQRQMAEKNLYNAWRSMSELRDSVAFKRIKLQLLKQNLKLVSILKRQMVYLEGWSHMEREHSSSLQGATEALKASTLRLPVVGGAKVDIQALKEVTTSAIDILHTLESLMNSLLSKVYKTGSLVFELAKLASQECTLLSQSRDLLYTVAAMHVKQCSLRGHLLQLKGKSSPMQI